MELYNLFILGYLSVVQIWAVFAESYIKTVWVSPA